MSIDARPLSEWVGCMSGEGSRMLITANSSGDAHIRLLSAVLWWSALVPTRNPFDGIYNHVVAYRRGLPPLGTAPKPRRLAAGEAGTVALAIGVLLRS